MNDAAALTETTYYILLSLWQPQHGYGIMQRALAVSGGRVRLAAGTLYGALNTMTEKGWIEQMPVEAGSRRKDYRLTEQGCRVLKDEMSRLSRLAADGKKVTRGEI